MIKHLVIGSGPSGIAVAKALLARGEAVTMIDGGKAVFPADPALHSRLVETEPNRWSQADRLAWQAPQFQTPAGQVRRFGSDAGMEAQDAIFADGSDKLALRASHAKGGLSMLWGGAVRPYAARDMTGWPVTADDLAPHYRAVADFLPIAGPDSDPLARHAPPKLGPQAEAVLTRAGDSAEVSVRAASTATGDACRACGMCLHGCPWGQIWQAQSTLQDLGQHDRFSYQSGPAVTAISETGTHVLVDRAGAEPLKAERIYLGAGVLETARLLLGMGWRDRLILRDSQFAFMPLLKAIPPRGVDQLPLTTLPKLFADIEPENESGHPAHAQIYGWNEFYIRDLMANYSKGLPGAKLALNMLARRMMVAQIFLHSDHGAQITVSAAADGKLRAATENGAEFDAVMASAQNRLARHMRRAGYHALKFASRKAEPGASFHVGASVPMSTNPNGAASDLIGRPHGLARVHVVDASVLPSIPAATITLSVMANAHRIGTLAGQ